MHSAMREGYYQDADRILRAADASWKEVVGRIQEELAMPDDVMPTLATVIDQREISVTDAMQILQENKTFEQWRLEMWRAVEAQDWAAAYVNSYQGFVVMQNATNRGLYVRDASPMLKQLQSELRQHMAALATTGLYK
jgi:hypothetical protein